MEDHSEFPRIGEPDNQGNRERVRTLLIVGWCTIPAIQYAASFMRTGLQVEGETWLPVLADWNLMPIYGCWIAISTIFAIDGMVYDRLKRELRS